MVNLSSMSRLENVALWLKRLVSTPTPMPRSWKMPWRESVSKWPSNHHVLKIFLKICVERGKKPQNNPVLPSSRGKSGELLSTCVVMAALNFSFFLRPFPFNPHSRYKAKMILTVLITQSHHSEIMLLAQLTNIQTTFPSLSAYRREECWCC